MVASGGMDGNVLLWDPQTGKLLSTCKGHRKWITSLAWEPAHLAMPATRRRTLLGLARALADGDIDLDPGCDRQSARAQLAALPGIGPWTVETIAMRALGDPDAFLPTDLGVVQLARALGLPTGAALLAHAERWRPWRAYAVQHLWATGEHAVNTMPIEGERA